MIRSLLLVVVAAAVLVAGCGGTGPVAVVNGVEIDRTDLDGIVDPGDEELSAERTRSILTALVQWTAMEQAAREDFGIEPTDAEIADFQDGVLAESGGAANREAFLQAQGVTEAGFRLSAVRLLVEAQVIEELQGSIESLTIEEAEQLLQDEPAAWTVVCAGVIVVATEEEGDAVIARLDDGEDFAALAAELSIAPGAESSGGSLGCALPIDWAPEIAAAALDAEPDGVIGPLEAALGYTVLRVEEKTEATAEVIQASVLRSEAAAALEDWIVDAVSRADIEIDESFGIWSTDPIPEILPPAG